MFVPKNGPVVANTVYADDKLVARDVAVTFPEVSFPTADLQAMGTFSMPITQLIEHMETSITKIGVDLGLGDLIKPDMKPLEFRWVQTVTAANSATKTVGCKAFINGIPNKIPGFGIAVGETIENEVTFATTRYVLVVDGTEIVHIDRLAGINRIGGKDYADFGSML